MVFAGLVLIIPIWRDMSLLLIKLLAYFMDGLWHGVMIVKVGRFLYMFGACVSKWKMALWRCTAVFS